MAAPQFRRATIEDCPALLAIRRDAILSLAAPRMVRQEAEHWAMRLDLPGMIERFGRMEIWVALGDDRIIGWVGLQQGWLENLYRDPDPSFQGVGSALLSHAEALMRERGHAVIGLKSAASALGFYQRHGYRPSAPREADGSWRHEKRLDVAAASPAD